MCKLNLEYSDAIVIASPGIKKLIRNFWKLSNE
jgi:hypothetical protein